MGLVLGIPFEIVAQGQLAINGPTTACPGVYSSYTFSCADCLNNNTWVVPPDWLVQEADSELVVEITSSGYLSVYSNLLSTGELVHDSVFISLSAPPSVTLQLPDTICSNQYLGFEYGQPAGGWMAGPGVEDQLIAGPLAGPGWHFYTYTWSDNNGCSNSAVDSMFMIDALNLEPVISGADTVCAGSTNLYFVSSQNQSFTYTWQGPSNWQIQDEGNAAWITPGNENGQILVVGSNACEVIATTVIQIVVKFPPTTPQWISFPADVVCSGDTVLIAITTEENSHVNWDFGPWPVLNITDTSFRSIVGQGAGAITASRSNECGTSETIAILVYGDICTGVADDSFDPWEIYPNPAKEFICVSAAFEANARYTITDLSGRMVDSGVLTANRIDIRSIAPGAYLFSYIDRQTSGTIHLIIE